MSAPTTTAGAYTGEHVELVSDKAFDDVVTDLQAELGTASTEKLMDRLSASDSFDDYAEECSAFAGRSNLIEVGFLNWGKVLTLAGTEMKAKLFIVGNPLTARKLLEAGGPEVGLYLPTKIFVFEGSDGRTHVSYDRFAPIMAAYGEQAEKVGGVVDGVLAGLADAAVAERAD